MSREKCWVYRGNPEKLMVFTAELWGKSRKNCTQHKWGITEKNERLAQYEQNRVASLSDTGEVKAKEREDCGMHCKHTDSS
jgi:hypothetical protein